MARKFILQKEEVPAKASFTIDYRGELNPQQYAAASAGEGSSLVIAGAGTGKTRTLIYRVAYLVESGVPPERIVLLTFTRRAASEMINRASALLDGRCGLVRGGTFHAYALAMLRIHSNQIGYPQQFTILDAGDAADVIDLLRTNAGLHKAGKRFPRKRSLYNIFSSAASLCQSSEDIIYARYPQFADYIQEIEQLRSDYAGYKAQHGLMDYDDLLENTTSLLNQHPNILRAEASKCRHILVDEYQDTNARQAELVRLLASVHGNVMVVGDDAQSIYRFRGADSQNIFDFPDMFEGTRVLKLEHNYRSTQQILDLANHIIDNARQKYDKRLFSEDKVGEIPAVVVAPDERDECRFVCQMIMTLREQDVPLNKMAVLFRSGFNSYGLEIELNKRNIPFVKYGGLKLSEAAHVKDVLSYVKVLENPRDAVAWTRILQLLDGIGPKTSHDLVEWIVAAQQDPFELEDRPYSPKYIEELKRLFALLKPLVSSKKRLSTQLENILDYYEPILEKKYFEDYPKRKQDLEQLVGLTERFSDRESLLSSMALDPIELSALEVEASDKDELPLILSTIHSAKGLEYHTVFIIQALDGVIPSAYSVKDQEALDEELRLMYVAVTRAEENLFISYPSVQYKRFQGEYFSKPSRYIADVPEELLEPWVLVEEPASIDESKRLRETLPD